MQSRINYLLGLPEPFIHFFYFPLLISCYQFFCIFQAILGDKKCPRIWNWSRVFYSTPICLDIILRIRDFSTTRKRAGHWIRQKFRKNFAQLTTEIFFDGLLFRIFCANIRILPNLGSYITINRSKSENFTLFIAKVFSKHLIIQYHGRAEICWNLMFKFFLKCLICRHYLNWI